MTESVRDDLSDSAYEWVVVLQMYLYMIVISWGSNRHLQSEPVVYM